MAHIYPSLMAADPLNLGSVIKKLDPIAHGYHLDVMDFHFAPNLTLGISTVNAIGQASTRPVWVHLMVDNPLPYFPRFELPAGTTITVHIEITTDMRQAIRLINERKWNAGIAISPKTNIQRVMPYVEYINQVLIMGVEPGFSGQAFLPDVISKIEPIVGFRNTSGIDFKIAMDGGISAANIPQLQEKGVEQFAVGAEIFNTDSIVKNLESLEALLGN